MNIYEVKAKQYDARNGKRLGIIVQAETPKDAEYLIWASVIGLPKETQFDTVQLGEASEPKRKIIMTNWT